jgi:anti-sigma factor RsiW
VTGPERHAGDRLAALADGRLREPERTRVLTHLGRCATCRSEYDSQLAMKGLLGALGEPGAPVDLRMRLTGLSSPAAVPVTRSSDRPPGRSLGLRRPRRKPHAPRSARYRVGRAGVGVLLVAVLALGGAYALGGAPSGALVTPPIDRYVRDHAAVSGGLPLTEPVLWQLPAGRVGTLPPAAAQRAAPASFGASRDTP